MVAIPFEKRSYVDCGSVNKLSQLAVPGRWCAVHTLQDRPGTGVRNKANLQCRRGGFQTRPYGYER